MCIRDRALTARGEEIERIALEEKLASETLDVTMPGKPIALGKKHPLNVVLDEFKEIFLGLGFSIAEGPEVELSLIHISRMVSIMVSTCSASAAKHSSV